MAWQAHREFCLMFDAFSVAEAVLPSRPSDQAAEVRIFHPPADDTKVNRALLAGRCVSPDERQGTRWYHTYVCGITITTSCSTTYTVSLRWCAAQLHTRFPLN